MTRIVGHKVETRMDAYLRSQPERHWRVVVHNTVFELHATKGWRRIRHKQTEQRVRRLPPDWTRVRSTYKSAFRKPKPEPFEMTGPQRERALMRHGWYRRKLRKEAAAQQIAAG